MPSGRRRVTQGLINQMGELRRQGLPFHEIARRLGCTTTEVRRPETEQAAHLGCLFSIGTAGFEPATP